MTLAFQVWNSDAKSTGGWGRDVHALCSTPALGESALSSAGAISANSPVSLIQPDTATRGGLSEALGRSIVRKK
jgi:hypothetical protein